LSKTMNVKTYILLLTMAIMTLACSKDNAAIEEPLTDVSGVTDGLVPVRLSISEQHVFDITRAATSIISFNANEKVNVFVKPNGATDYAPYEFSVHESGQSVALDPPAIPPFFPAGEGSAVQVYAYYPASATTTFTVQDDQTSDANYKRSDLMYASNRTITKGVDDGNDMLTMNHQMAQLRITANPQLGSGLTITSVEVEAKKSVTFTPGGTTVTATTGSAGTITALNAAGTGYIVIPPQEMEGVTIRVVTGTGTAEETATYLFHSTGSFVAGSSYSISLMVTPEHLGTTSVINNWTGINSVNATPSGNLTILPIGAQELEYNGYEHKPDVTVQKDGVTIDKNDYEMHYVNNTDAGRAYIIVVGKNGTAIEGCTGIATFIIAQANAEISYDSDTETKTYGNPNFIKKLTNTGDGVVTYVSSDPTVASVNATTGEVTILKAGTTTISATVENGANYVYKSDKKTASYTMTVNRALGSITFGSATPSKTWSSTTANNTFTQNVTNTGTAPVTYTIDEDLNTCGATIEGSTVTFQKAGYVLVKATVVDDERYSYTKKTASYLLTVNKAAGYVTLTANSGSIPAGNSIALTVNTSHNNVLSAAATSGETGRITSITGPVNNKFTVTTGGTTSTSVTITVTCAADDYYNAATATYTLTIAPSYDIKKLPLYYMAEYNISDAAGTKFATTATGGRFFMWAETMSKFAAQNTCYSTYKNAGKGPNKQWHLPVEAEWWGLIPVHCPSTYVSIYSYVSSSHTTEYKSGYIMPVWGYNSKTKAGIPETSYFVYCNTNELHAIRFLGTEFCSAWKWVWANGRMTIYATLIGNIGANRNDAAAWYSSNFKYVTFGNDAIKGAVMRVIYASGETYTSNDQSGKNVGVCAWFYTATEGSRGAGSVYVATVGSARAFVYNDRTTYGFHVRLFRDN
jgi:hypothetical protein